MSPRPPPVTCRRGRKGKQEIGSGLERTPFVDQERILVVDDEADVGEMVSKIINLMGHEAVTAVNGKVALEILRNQPFSIMITDVKMPEMDGFELMKAVRDQFPGTYIICMTAHGASYSYTDVIGVGGADYITKPFTIDEMMAKLNRVIREKSLITDLTQKSAELGKANEELKRLDQLKSTFISSVSHELRTPLTVIKEFISLMLEGHVGTLTEDQQEYLGIAKKNIMRLTNLIETLLDFSRIESGKGLKLRFEPVRLMEVVEDAAMTFSQQLEEKRITFENRLDPDTPLVLIDRNRLVEVFINLVGNGIKFTPPGGKITVDPRGLTEKRDYLKIVVTDTGVGISPEDLPKVFDRFYQGGRTQTGLITGTGLGLAISKEIVEGHQGSIQAENKSENGASFVLTLPIFGIETIYSLILNPMLEEAERDKVPFSIIRVDFWEQRTKRESVLSHESWEGVMYALQKMVRTVDTVIPFQSSAVYIFSFNDKKLAKEIGERIQVKLTQGNYTPKGINIQFKTYSYPKEARSKEEFLKGCRLFLKED
ncbi:MAG: multi-sensor signal transduction histidine kinase [Deltaproteobacteria bacterium]|nr:multi-sensor signal transduction histidine kinase [Deltaproteobacteria bacterium]